MEIEGGKISKLPFWMANIAVLYTDLLYARPLTSSPVDTTHAVLHLQKRHHNRTGVRLFHSLNSIGLPQLPYNGLSGA